VSKIFTISTRRVSHRTAFCRQLIENKWPYSILRMANKLFKEAPEKGEFFAGVYRCHR